MRNSVCMWMAVVSGIIGWVLLITGTFTAYWLHIFADSQDRSVDVSFGLFRFCLNGRCIRPPEVFGSMRVWRACAILSWLILGVALASLGLCMRDNSAKDRRCLLITTIVVSVVSLVMAGVAVGVFMGPVEKDLAHHSYTYHQQLDFQDYYSWSFYVFIVGGVLTAITTIAVIITLAWETCDCRCDCADTQNVGSVIIAPINSFSYMPGPYSVSGQPGAHVGAPPTHLGAPPTHLGAPPTHIGSPPTHLGPPPGALPKQYQTGPDGSVYGYDQHSV